MLKQDYWNFSLHLSPYSIFISLIFLKRKFSSFAMIFLIRLPRQYAMKQDKWDCVPKTCEIWNHTHPNIFIWEKTKKLAITFVSYLNSHITLDLCTTTFKLSSVAANCGISILPRCTGEDKDSGKLDLHVYLDSQLSNLC